MTVRRKTALLLSLGMGPALALAQAAAPEASDLELRIDRCAVLGDASARLACYDGLARTTPGKLAAGGAAVGVPDPGKDSKLVNALVMPASTQPGEPPAKTDAAVPAKVAELTTIPPQDKVSRMVQWWELDRSAKRGVFNFRPHRDSYLLLANYSTSNNDTPFQEFSPDGLKSKHVELMYQLSFKMKMIEQAFGWPVDLWFGYTQESFWQAYNKSESSPFRETNYQPELMLTTPLALNLGGVDVRFLTLGLVHQSNGQTSTLSRSWNRVYAQVGAEKGNFGVNFRLWRRLDNARSDNDNIDITDYLGHGDLSASYRFDGHELSVTARRNFHTSHGAIQAGWAFPLSANLKGYVQFFSGYGESLIDYNYAQKSLGAGFKVDF
ncbi:phospholipase A1 [Duganella sp. 1411]|uniref:phospholipase A n=1 Tax=Duganella sp. 1411 TaxID=2806572 RepID=UPI001B4B276C|nr:phospholipase A [Duganella sp. 1411]MBP1202315.1 phospholipase A1 [Duganella sp. 1411]